MVIDGGEKFLIKMINHKKNEINERVIKWNDFRRVVKKLPAEETTSIYMIFREVPQGKTPAMLYVGKTKQSLDKRLSQHFSEVNRALEGKNEWSLKTRWMYQVLKEGYNLKIVTLNKVPNSKATEIELEWIVYMGIAGFDMLNGDNTKYLNNKIQ